MAGIAARVTDKDSRKLHRVVEQHAEVIDALANMIVIIEGKPRMLGKLEFMGDHCIIRVNEHRELGN